MRVSRQLKSLSAVVAAGIVATGAEAQSGCQLELSPAEIGPRATRSESQSMSVATSPSPGEGDLLLGESRLLHQLLLPDSRRVSWPKSSSFSRLPWFSSRGEGQPSDCEDLRENATACDEDE
jgi:hypothetical protein